MGATQAATTVAGRLGFVGAAALGAGGFLGGHLSYARAVGVEQTVFEQPVDEWADVAADADLIEGEPHAGSAGGEDVVSTSSASSRCLPSQARASTGCAATRAASSPSTRTAGSSACRTVAS